MGVAFHWASIPQGRDAEKQNDSTLRVIKCPYWHLATKELMPFVVSAAQAAECFSFAVVPAPLNL